MAEIFPGLTPARSRARGSISFSPLRWLARYAPLPFGKESVTREIPSNRQSPNLLLQFAAA